MLAESQAHHTPNWYDYTQLEMTVIPIPNGQKHPNFRWKRLQWTKLHVLLDDPKHTQSLAWLYHLGGDGLAVICGRPSENLFVIDCDTMQCLTDTQKQLALRGIHAPCVISSRGGHLYLRSRQGAVQGVKMRDGEIKGDGELAVLPPTVHKSGHIYRWQGDTPPHHIPTVDTDDLDFLLTPDGDPLQLTVASNSGRRLHDDTRRYLSHGAAAGNRNNALFNAARDYKYIGYDRPRAYHDLIRIAKASGLQDNEIIATIDSAYNHTSPSLRSGEGFREGIQTSTTQQLNTFIEFVKWEGRTGNTDKTIMAALIKRRALDAHTRHNGEFRASYRELMELSGIKGWKTLQRSIQRLTDRGFIQKAGHDPVSKATLYRFSNMVIMFCPVHNLGTNTAGAVRSTYCLTYAHPLSKTIGSTATSIYNYLLKHGCQTTKQIATALGKHRTTISRHLAKLIDHNLVSRNHHTHTAIIIDAIQEASLSQKLQAYTDQLALQAKHDRERALFALNPIMQHLFQQNHKKQEAHS